MRTSNKNLVKDAASACVELIACSHALSCELTVRVDKDRAHTIRFQHAGGRHGCGWEEPGVWARCVTSAPDLPTCHINAAAAFSNKANLVDQVVNAFDKLPDLDGPVTVTIVSEAAGDPLPTLSGRTGDNGLAVVS